MPELPEVQTVVDYLRPELLGETVHKVSVPANYKRAVGPPSLRTFNKCIAGQVIQDVRRRAKLIVLVLDKGCISIHLRMTGRVLINEPEQNDLRYITATIELGAGHNIYFKDVRKFGRIKYHNHWSDLDALYGPEPLSDRFSYRWLKDSCLSRDRMMKPLLLDQQFIAGLGNIYVDEALWTAGIHPCRTSSSLTSDELRKLARAIPRILRSSIRLNGTTFQSFYFGEETPGRFASQLKVFGKQGTACKRCKTEIVKVRVAQRGTHLCPTCQHVN